MNHHHDHGGMQHSGEVSSSSSMIGNMIGNNGMGNMSHFEPTTESLNITKYNEDRAGQSLAHLVAGSGFLIVGLLSIVGMLRRYHAGQKTRTPFHSATSVMNVKIGARTVYLDSLFRTVVSGSGSTWWLGLYGFHYGYGEDFVMDAQHTSIVLMQVWAGVIELLTVYDRPVVPDLDYLANAVAFFYMFFSFANHEHLRQPVDAHFHVLLNLIVVLAAASYTVEQMCRSSLVVSITRSVAVTMIGVWMIVIAYTVFGKPAVAWDLTDMDNVAGANMFLGLMALLLLLFVFLVSYKSRHCVVHK